MEEAWAAGGVGVGAKAAASARWMEEFQGQRPAMPAHARPPVAGAGPSSLSSFSPLPRHAEVFQCLNEPLRGFLRGDFADAMAMTKDGHVSAALNEVAQMLGVPGLSKLRRRTDIIARQIFADRESVEPSHRTIMDQRSFVDRQVNALMGALRMEEVVGYTSTLPPQRNQAELEKAWQSQAQAQAQAASAPSANPNYMGGPWANQFHNQQQHLGPMPVAPPPMMNSMAGGQLFYQNNNTQQNTPAEKQQQAPVEASEDKSAEEELLHHTRALEATMASSSEPKFRQSKFLNFVSKMNTGEIKIVDEHLVDESKQQTAAPEVARKEDWANEFQQMNLKEAPPVSDQWVKDFDHFNAHPTSTWADEFSNQGGTTMPDEWANEFAEHYVSATPNAMDATQRNYQYSDSNPFESSENPFEIGQELYKSGILSEAALAFEAAISKEIQVAESWHMLGLVHAENDDDKQAIASMVNAHAADPNNLDVLLDLGVSHTNELEAHEAINYMRQWVSQHPEYRSAIALASPEVNVAETIRLFDSIGQSNPKDPQIFTALGVLYNLSKEYNKAEEAFRHALSLQEDNHSLWNKLGATQANSSNSKEAVKAYQQALNIKPNYVRAWSNMGIGFSNQGMYKEAVPYYVRALSMNGNAEPLWGYLKIAMACSGMLELLPLVNDRNIAALSKEFPV
jgi:peroxin-5